MSNKKKSIFETAADELLEESWGGGGSTFGGAGGGGGGGGFRNRLGAAKTWHGGSPPGRGMTGGPGGLNTIDIAQEDEEIAKLAGKNKIYPLEQINEYLVSAFVNLGNVESQLHSCVKYNKILTKNKEKKALLDHNYRKVKAVREMVRAIAEDLDRITLS